jgi:lipoprotein-anchoring transpeptidase ErfK/SrfK
MKRTSIAARLIEGGRTGRRLAPGFIMAAVLAIAPWPLAAAPKPLPPVTFDQPDLPDLVPIKGEEQLAAPLRRTPVFYRTSQPAGSIVIDSSERYLYFITGQGTALRYGVAVGREGFAWEGAMKVRKKVEWPDWKPPRDMIAREKKKGKVLPALVKGGPGNPLGARALYLGRSEYRIHGTNQPKSIGQAASSGCIRMLNEHVIDLYDRVKLRARVVVLP